MGEGQRQRYDLEEIKARFTLSEVIGQAMPLRRAGSEHIGLCPFHGERSPSFTVSDRQRFYHCFGCGAHGSVIDWMVNTRNMSFAEAVRELAHAVGVEALGVGILPERKAKANEAFKDEEERAARLQSLVAEVWRRGVPANGTPVEAYLRSRGLALPNGVPVSLRYLPNCPATVSDEVKVLSVAPAMIGGVQDGEGRIIAIHRTFILPDGSGKQLVGKANPKAKKMLGRVMTGAVRLAPRAGHVFVTEGIETGLAVLEALGAGGCVWAGLSLAGMGAVILPEGVNRVTLCGDSDIKNFEARATEEACKLKARSGLPVKVALPPEGMDFNDWLVSLKQTRAA